MNSFLKATNVKKEPKKNGPSLRLSRPMERVAYGYLLSLTDIENYNNLERKVLEAIQEKLEKCGESSSLNFTTLRRLLWDRIKALPGSANSTDASKLRSWFSDKFPEVHLPATVTSKSKESPGKENSRKKSNKKKSQKRKWTADSQSPERWNDSNDSSEFEEFEGVFVVTPSRKGGFRQSKRKFLFVNYTTNDWTKLLRRSLADLIEVNGGCVVKDKCMIQTDPGIYVVSVGPFCAELSNLVEKYGVDIYKPSLIVDATIVNEFSPDLKWHKLVDISEWKCGTFPEKNKYPSIYGREFKDTGTNVKWVFQSPLSYNDKSVCCSPIDEEFQPESNFKIMCQAEWMSTKQTVYSRIQTKRKQNHHEAEDIVNVMEVSCLEAEGNQEIELEIQKDTQEIKTEISVNFFGERVKLVGDDCLVNALAFVNPDKIRPLWTLNKLNAIYSDPMNNELQVEGLWNLAGLGANEDHFKPIYVGKTKQKPSIIKSDLFKFLICRLNEYRLGIKESYTENPKLWDGKISKEFLITLFTKEKLENDPEKEKQRIESFLEILNEYYNHN